MNYDLKAYEIIQESMSLKSCIVIPIPVIVEIADQLAKLIPWFADDMKDLLVGDSCPRDAFTDAFTQKYLGCRWPSYSGHPLVKADFFARLDKLAADKGWLNVQE